MAKSQNGWPAAYQVGNTVYATPPLTKLSWITGSVRSGDVWTVMDYVARRFNNEVEKINPAHSWGFAPRPIRGSSTTLSNHASATAVDFNAPRHPLGKSNTFSVAQRAAIRRILKDTDGVVRWGGDYTGRKDEMHLEIVGSAVAVRKLADKIRSNTGITPPSTAKDWFSMATIDDLEEALKNVIYTPEFRTQSYQSVWENARWQVPGTERKESPRVFLEQTRVAAVQSVHAGLANAGFTDEQIDKIGQVLSETLGVEGEYEFEVTRKPVA